MISISGYETNERFRFIDSHRVHAGRVLTLTAHRMMSLRLEKSGLCHW